MGDREMERGKEGEEAMGGFDGVREGAWVILWSDGG